MQPQRDRLQLPNRLRGRGVVDDRPGEEGSGVVGGAERDGDRAVDSVLLLAARERPAGEHTRTRKQAQQPPVRTERSRTPVEGTLRILSIQ